MDGFASDAVKLALDKLLQRIGRKAVV